MSEPVLDINKPLIGHISQDTAYLVEDYPYGFRLRCKIRYWLEFKKGKGFRFMSQTSNPKIPADSYGGIYWNKPKASTYIENAAFMYLDSNNHVQWHGLGIYNNAAEAQEFLSTFGEFINTEWLPVLERWVALKKAYEAKKAELVAKQGVDNFSQNNTAAVVAVKTVEFNVNYGGGRVEKLEVKA